VSLSWLDRLSLYVHPRRVVLERRAWREAPRRHWVDVAPPSAGEPDWQPVLAAVASALAADGRRGGRAGLVVADHFVRYALLPWSDDVVGARARQAVARALLRNTAGERADALELALDRPRFRRPGLAAGIERSFLDSLRGVLRQQRVAISSLQPRLVRELAAGRRKLAGFDGWFVSADAERLTLARLRRGSLVTLRNQRTTREALSTELVAILAAESGGEEGGKLLFCCDAPLQLEPAIGGWEVSPWPSSLPGGTHA